MSKTKTKKPKSKDLSLQLDGHVYIIEDGVKTEIEQKHVLQILLYAIEDACQAVLDMPKDKREKFVSGVKAAQKLDKELQKLDKKRAKK